MAKQGLDIEALAEAVDEVRESMRALVAGLIVDGFTEEQARRLVAGAIGGRPTDNSEED